MLQKFYTERLNKTPKHVDGLGRKSRIASTKAELTQTATQLDILIDEVKR